jgi:hypothetical protein
MKDIPLLEWALKDRDGSCRDINFSEHISRYSALKLLDAIASEWSLCSATDAEGNSLSATDMRNQLEASKGSLSTLWTEGPLIRQWQCYLYWNRSDDVFCEMSFFPDDIVESEFNMPNFMALLARFINATRSAEYYVRYENASWRHGDMSATSSVIFSHCSLPLDA